MPKGFSTILKKKLLSHAVDVQRIAEDVRGKVLLNLMELDQELQRAIYAVDIPGTPRTDYQQKRLENLLQSTKDTIKSSYKEANDVLKSQLLEIADLQSIAIPNIFNTLFKGDVVSVSFTRNDLEVLARGDLLGAPAKEWWAKQTNDAVHRFTTQIRMGVLQGETNAQLVTRVIGKSLGKRVITDIEGNQTIVNNFEGGIMDVSKREATALVRTSVQSVSNQVLEQTYTQNQDILDGRQAVATLDLKTTPMCRSRDGGLWDNDGNPLKESPIQIPFPGSPPWHFNCRTIIVPIIKSWDDLAGMKGLPELAPSTRSALDGQVPEDVTYENWLREQSVERQQEVLGPGKWELWKDGKLTMPDMVDQQGNPLTIEELKAKI